MGKVRKYKIKENRSIHGKLFAEAGVIVFGLKGFDYGLASDDTRHFGIKHVSVTLSPDGDYPCFTIPEKDLEEIK
jgi:hypothetical protein